MALMWVLLGADAGGATAVGEVMVVMVIVVVVSVVTLTVLPLLYLRSVSEKAMYVVLVRDTRRGPASDILRLGQRTMTLAGPMKAVFGSAMGAATSGFVVANL
ncbi:hypothetical protein CONLIGDRAFT_628334, partial [Coniochaeta ligniaria NRRL 30616]